MDVQQKLDDIAASVRNAKSMPMSASCVINRAELLAMLDELRGTLPNELLQAQQTMADREELVEAARREAEQIINGAHGERGALISETEVVRRAQAEADRVLAETRAEVEEQRREADDYVDAKLANFEVVLTKTLGAIGRGREKLRGGGMPVPGEDGEEFVQDAFRTPSPEVDEYVDAKLATLETVLGKTLEAVGKGRDKLLGKQPIDELGAYLADADADQAGRASEIAAALAEAGLTPAEPEYGEPEYAAEPRYAEPEYAEPEYAAAPAEIPAPSVSPEGTQQHWYGTPEPWQQQPQPVDYQQQPQYAGYEQQHVDPYDPAAAYAANGYAQQAPAAYPPQQYDYPAAGSAYPEYAPPQQQPQHGQQSLDETSFFDTGFIDMSRLKELGGGH